MPEDFSSVVDNNTLVEFGLIKNVALPIKLLGNGDWKRSLSFSIAKITEGAKAKIEAAGGKILEA